MLKKDTEKINEGVSGDSLSLLEQLPRELLQEKIAKYLSDKDLSRLSQASKWMFFTHHEALEKKAAQTLLPYVIKGEETEALKMIDANPRLLLISSQATDYSGRSYIGFTPFQCALLCHDVTLWKKIEPYFGRLPNGKKEMVSQFKALFPEGLPQQKFYDFTQLGQFISSSSDADIMEALQKKDNDTPICQALNDFRKTFTDIAIKELFFNPLHFNASLNVFNKHFYSWSGNQRDLFWRQVCGYTQRFLPACYAQDIARWRLDSNDPKKPVSRSLNFLYEGASYYPLRQLSGLGFDFAVNPVGGRHPCLLTPLDNRLLMNYVEQIQRNYSDLSTACDIIDYPSRPATI